MNWQVPECWKEAWRKPHQDQPPHPFLAAALAAEVDRIRDEVRRMAPLLDFDQLRRMCGDDPPRLHYPGAIDTTAREVP